MSVSPDCSCAWLAELLEVSIDYLLGLLGLKIKPGAEEGPLGRTRRAYEEVNRLPRHSQERIVRVVEELLIAHRAKV